LFVGALFAACSFQLLPPLPPSFYISSMNANRALGTEQSNAVRTAASIADAAYKNKNRRRMKDYSSGSNSSNSSMGPS
jgi:hypothetical protein